MSQIEIIRATDWRPHAAALKQVFLVGDLKQPILHPFIRRHDIELIICDYQPGDNGLPHWHQEVDEIEIVLQGRVGYREISTGDMLWFGPGDLLSIRHGVCVERVVTEATRTVAIKLPSRAEKIHCRECRRDCSYRREPFYCS
jgi:redox-sensitive bicupin YhaK (pirin superfamily)